MIPKEPTDVEKQVLTAFQADDISVVDADGAEISGDFLRGLFLGEYDEKANYRGTCIANAVVSDALNMEFCETKFPVRMPFTLRTLKWLLMCFSTMDSWQWAR